MLALLVLTACGGRFLDDATDEPSPTSTLEGPLGVCENRIEYSNDRNYQTTTTARLGYDAAGHMVRYLEISARGYAPLSLKRTYDDDGLLRRQDESFPRIGPDRRHATWEYDATARPIAITFDVEDTPPRSTYTTIAYDSEGRRLTVESKRNGVLSDVTHFSYVPGDGAPATEIVEEAHDLGADGTIDWTWRYGFAGSWYVFLEAVRNGKVDAREIFTYSDLARGELERRDFDHDGDGVIDDVDRFTWVNHHIVHASHTLSDFPEDSPQSHDLEWDGAGHLVKRTWKTPRYTFVTTFDWGAEGLVRVARRDGKSGEPIERWSFGYGCPAGRPMVVRIAPVVDWQRELEPMPFTLDRAKFWVFPEVF